jgi:PadR family transcriptional regulator AphA
MNYRLVENAQNNYVEALAGDSRIEKENDALDLVAACVEFRTHRLLLDAENLPEDFYHLHTGLAGAVLQKFANYAIKVAAVLSPELVKQGKLQEMVLEANRSNQMFHVFYDREKAVEWLVG